MERLLISYILFSINQSQIYKLESSMEANCCVFPAPSEYNLSDIINNILLIPKKKDVSPQFYHDKYLMKNTNQNNDFLTLVRSRKGKHLSTNNSTAQSVPLLHEKKFQVYSDRNKKTNSQGVMKLKAHINKYTQGNLEKVNDEIPCLFLSSLNYQKIMVFFHGNGEDLSTSYDFAKYINKQLDIPVLMMQYQGYSIYQGTSSPKNIIKDSKIVMDFLLQNSFDVKDIILFGRSIGGAIAFQAASHYNTSCLILLSPFLSLKKVAEDLYGKCASFALKQTLDNATIAQTVECPILIIHGLKDTLVPYHHSVSILSQCKGFTRLKLAENMTHVKFNFKSDFIMPVKKFLTDFQIWKEE